jgi:hypothetical protein
MLKLVRILAILGVIAPAMVLAQYYPRPIRGIAPGTPKPGAYKDVAGSFHGKLKDLNNKEIMIETADSQILTIHRSRKTKFFKGTQSIKPSEIDIETPITVDATEEVDLSLSALTVTVDTPKKAAENK